LSTENRARSNKEFDTTATEENAIMPAAAEGVRATPKEGSIAPVDKH